MRVLRWLIFALFIIPSLVIIGWFFNNTYLISVIPGLTPMNPLTAVVFISVAIALYAHIRNYSFAPKLLLLVGVVTTLIGFIMIGNYFLSFNIPIDRILFQDKLGTNRVAPNTAFNFFIIGLLLITYLFKQRRSPLIITLLVISIFISLLSLAVYLYGLKALLGIARFTPMALPTAICFLIIDAIIAARIFKLGKVFLNKRIIISLLVLLSLTLGTNIALHHSYRQAEARQNDMEAAHDQITTVSESRIIIRDAEVGLRGFLATGSEQYIYPYADASERHEATMQRLATRFTSKDYNRNSQAFESIRESAKFMFSLLEESAALKRAGKSSAALQRLDSFEGWYHTNKIKNNAAFIEQGYEDKLAHLRDISKINHRDDILMLSIVSVMNTILVIAALIFIHRSLRDLSKAKHKQQDSVRRLKQTLTKDETLLASIGDGVFAVDSKGRITLFNRAAEEISGFSKEEVIGSLYHEVLVFQTEDTKVNDHSFIVKAIKGERAIMTKNTCLIHKNGSQIAVEDSAAPLLNEKGEALGAIVIFRDSTNERNLERAKDDFVSLASHQLRTPATAVKQFLAMFLQGYAGNFTEEQRDYLQQAYDNNELEITMIEELLSIARIESGHMKIKREPTDITKLIDEAISLHAQNLEKRKQSIKLEKPNEPVITQIDPNLIRMVLDNLISNACKYSPDGTETIITLIKDNNHLKLSVKDSGIGMKPEDIPKLYARFMRLEDPRAANTSGTGLGLYLVKKIIDMHGGTIAVESTYGQGTTFSIELNS